MPISSPILDYLQTLHSRYAPLQDAQIASYIAELVTANPNWFGICITTTDGHVYEVGDTCPPFTIQSISKPLVCGLALEDQGCEPVPQKVGVEPTGDAFNSIRLASEGGRPLNPMINAGAIATTSLVARHSDEDELNRRGRLPIRTNHRAIGHMLRNFDILKPFFGWPLT